MNFTNAEIPIEALPQVEAVELHPLEREYLQVQRIVYIITTLIMLAIAGLLFYFIENIQKDFIIIAASVAFISLTVFGWVSMRLSFINSGYALREKDVLYRSGWFIRKTRVVPLNRVQHVSVQSGPIERKYRLASVSIYTAGAGQADFTIQGITNETALQIKDWITGQLHGSTNE